VKGFGVCKIDPPDRGARLGRRRGNWSWLGRITCIGHRITGKGVGATRGRAVGWEHVHVAIDDASRVAYCQVLPDEEALSASAVLRAAVAYYAGLWESR
jgi:hypothetical protein